VQLEVPAKSLVTDILKRQKTSS